MKSSIGRLTDQALAAKLWGGSFIHFPPYRFPCGAELQQPFDRFSLNLVKELLIEV